jgi:G3E family GTPase
MRMIQGDWPGVIRSKGFFWLATRMEWAGSWSQAGAACRIEAGGFWWAAVPKNQWPDDDQQCREIVGLWKKPWGDRRQEIVVIGSELDVERLTERLDACLLTDTEMALGPEGWAHFPDPFLPWTVREEPAPEAQPTHIRAS